LSRFSFCRADSSGPKHMNLKLTRAKLESLTQDLIDRTVPPCKACLKDAGVSTSEVDEVHFPPCLNRYTKNMRVCICVCIHE